MVGLRAAPAVNALAMAIWIELALPPSMRENAIRLPLSSATAMTCGTPMAVAFFSAAAIMIKASSRDRRLMLSMLWFLPADMLFNAYAMEHR